MKTKGFKLISFVLMLSLLLSVFSLSACTDDEPRTLDSVEQSIVGIWKRATSDRIFYFNSDGTWEAPGYVDKRFQFRHTGDGIDDERGHYEIIDCEFDQWALFDLEPDKLYSIINGTVYDKQGLERQQI